MEFGRWPGLFVFLQVVGQVVELIDAPLFGFSDDELLDHATDQGHLDMAPVRDPVDAGLACVASSSMSALTVTGFPTMVRA
jgi:hypothetical protein